jgi:hypothetical protein
MSQGINLTVGQGNNKSIQGNVFLLAFFAAQLNDHGFIQRKDARFFDRSVHWYQ